MAKAAFWTNTDTEVRKRMTTIYVKPNDDGLIKLIALLEMGK